MDNYYEKYGYKDHDQGNKKNKGNQSGLYVSLGNCNNAINDSGKLSMEATMAKLFKG